MIRNATVNDLDILSQYGEYFWKQTPYYGKIPYSQETVIELLLCMMKDHYIIVYEEMNEITGFLGMLVAPLLFNTEYFTATEVFFFVRPSKRGRGISSQLHDRAEEDLASGVDIMSYGDMSTASDMDQYYRSRGYTQTERAYTKVL